MCFFGFVVLCLPVRYFCIVQECRKVCFFLSCNWIGTLLARSSVKFASGLSERCSDECFIVTSNLDVAETMRYFEKSFDSCSNSCCLV